MECLWFTQKKKCHFGRISSISISDDLNANHPKWHCGNVLLLINYSYRTVSLLVILLHPPVHTSENFLIQTRTFEATPFLFEFLHYFAIISHCFQNSNSISDMVYSSNPIPSRRLISISLFHHSIQQHVFQPTSNFHLLLYSFNLPHAALPVHVLK